MTQQLTIIHEQVVLERNFKVYGTPNEPLFLAKDVAEWIDYAGRTGQLLETIDEDEKLMHKLYASGQNRNMWFVTEDGLYEVLFQSRKPIARQFKKQVKQILKQIRQTGGYIPVNQEESETEILAKAVLIAQNTIERQKALIAQKETENQKLLVIVDEQDEVIKQYENMFNPNKNYRMDEFGSMVGIGRNTLFAILRDLKILKSSNVPFAQHMKHFKVCQSRNGFTYTVVTPEGVKYLIKRLTKEGYINW